PNSRTGQRMGNGQLVDSMIHDGLRDAFNQYHMGITAENMAERYEISRQQQDAFALASQQKAVAAQQAGRFADEITPVEVPQRKDEPLPIDQDEQPRDNTTLQLLGKMRPALRNDGKVTAGNASS